MYGIYRQFHAIATYHQIYVKCHTANSKPFEIAINIISEGKGRQHTTSELI